MIKGIEKEFAKLKAHAKKLDKIVALELKMKAMLDELDQPTVEDALDEFWSDLNVFDMKVETAIEYHEEKGHMPLVRRLATIQRCAEDLNGF